MLARPELHLFEELAGQDWEKPDSAARGYHIGSPKARILYHFDCRKSQHPGVVQHEEELRLRLHDQRQHILGVEEGVILARRLRVLVHRGPEIRGELDRHPINSIHLGVHPVLPVPDVFT